MEISKDEIRQIGIDTGLLDKDLGDSDQMVTDYGCCDNELIDFCQRIIEAEKAHIDAKLSTVA